MKEARTTLLSLAPKGFQISSSSCYNYTENYSQGTAQAKQHHAGRGINAKVSLQKPPRIGVEKLVINLHWSTANVNHIVDAGSRNKSALTISKDAKAIIPSNIASVQHPGKTWRKRDILPDHSWDQSRTNSITPMTFLFLDTRITQREISVQTPEEVVTPVENAILHVTRSGQGITLLNLSFFECDTTFKCLNEILLLLTLPELDMYFRDHRTNRFIFVVR